MQKSKSAPNTLDSLKDFVREIEHKSREGASIAEWHHNGGSEFKGVVYDWVREKGWRDSHTGGYGPNSNAFCERRVGDAAPDY